MKEQDRNEKEFLDRINTELDHAESSLDENTLRALRLARSRAVTAYEKKKQLPNIWQVWQPVGAVAIAVTVAIVGVNVQLAQQDEKLHLQSIEDLQMLSAGEELELYEELEFYQWLDLEERTG